MTDSQFIVGAPMRPTSHFIGPLAWWSDSLTCGGIERQVVSSARFFQQQGKNITLLCRSISHSGGNDFFLQEAQASSRVLGFSLYMVDHDLFYEARAIVSSFVSGASQVFIDSVSAYAAWLLRVRPKLLHLWSADHLEPLLAAFIAGVPKIIIAGQSLSPAQRAPYGFESVDDHAAFAILANLMQFPHVVMTNNSRAGCRTYEDWLGLPPGTVRLTPNVFDLDAWPQPETAQVEHLRQSLGIPEKARVLGGLFRFVSIKDPELWLSTAIRACAAVPDLYAVVGGQGPELEPLRSRMAETPFAERILFPGPVRDVPAFLSLCSVFMLTSHVEGLPNVLLEAQAYKVPVVTTCCGGVADVVEHGKSGFVMGERDAVVMAKHVEFLLGHDNVARSAGEAGRQRVAENFSPERTMGMLWDVYADILPSEFPPRAAAQDACRSTLEPGDQQCPLVSIVLPTYNHLSFLPLAIESVLGQDYPNFELVVVDDGSSDGTASYLETLESPRIRIESGPNTRLPTALNRGFALARGDYLTWTSADNICLPHFCSSLAGALRAYPQSGFASSAFARISPQGWAIDRLAGEASLPAMLCCNIGMASFMYRRDVAEQAGQYDPRLEGAEDWDMWLRMLSVTQPVYVPQVLYHYRWHDDSMRVRLSAKVLEASTRVAFKALRRMEQSGGIGGLFPQVERCKDPDLALFHANLVMGSRMIRSDSFLKGAAVKYLEAAYNMRPDDLTAMGNYAVALYWQGRLDEAGELFRLGKAKVSKIFDNLQAACAKQRRNIGQYLFNCPVLSVPGVFESELMHRVENEQLVYSKNPRMISSFSMGEHNNFLCYSNRSEKNKKMAVWGWWQGKNLGDNWIKACMQDIFPDAYMMPTSELNINDYSFVVCGGGGLWFDSVIAPWEQKIVTKFGVMGLGAEFPHINSRARDLSRQAEFFFVRDKYSLDCMGINDIAPSVDITFFKPLAWAESFDSKKLFFVWRDGSDFLANPNNEKFKKFINYGKYENNKHHVDVIVSNEFSKIVCDDFQTVDDDISAHIGDCGFVITGRFHGVIMAIQRGLPVIAIDICPKIRILMRDCGLEDYCIKMNEFGKLEELIRRAQSEIDYIRKKEEAYRTKAISVINRDVELARGIVKKILR